ncbi:MAG: tetratricopeptide repeat protein, partial [Pseudomonadales bacterium]|nr:tetratricopeptide repeat protein [Pseudomonadales bacterium]
MNFVARQCSFLIGVVIVLAMWGCAVNEIRHPAPAGEKAQVMKKIASSVAKPKTPTMHQDNYSVAVNSLLSLAKNQQESADYSSAAASIERALRINPKSTQAYYRLAEVRLDQGRFGEAEQLAKKTLSYVNFGSH